MAERSRSMPARQKEERGSREPSPEYEVKPEKKKKVAKKKAHHKGHSIANRPPWNDDTHIDGYDDVDEFGKEQLNEDWMSTLRDSDYSRARTYYRH